MGDRGGQPGGVPRESRQPRGCLGGDGDERVERVGVPVRPQQRPADIQPGGDAQVRVGCQRQDLARQFAYPVGLSGGEGEIGGGQQPPGLVPFAGAELGGAFQGARRCGGAAAALRLGRAVFEQCGYLLVGFQRRGGQVPGVAVRLVAERVRDLQVRRGALGERRGMVDGRPDKRMGELRARRVQPDQARRFRRGEGAGGKPGYAAAVRSGLSAAAASSSAARAAPGRAAYWAVMMAVS